jgi:hypothetical protein
MSASSEPLSNLIGPFGEGSGVPMNADGLAYSISGQVRGSDTMPLFECDKHQTNLPADVVRWRREE